MDLIENEEYGYCSLVKATNSVLDKMMIENVTHAKVTSTKRIEKNLIDPVAMHETIVNCIVHNDFTHEIPPVFDFQRQGRNDLLWWTDTGAKPRRFLQLFQYAKKS